MPVEVIGPPGETQTRTFTLDPTIAAKAVTLWLWGDNLGFHPELNGGISGKAAVQLNGGPWLAMSNASVNVLEPGKSFEGIDGSLFANIKLTVPISTLGALGTSNTIAFRFNATDGITTGFRIIGLNLLDASGNQLMPATAFAWDDPATWQAPLNDATDIAAGKNAWATATLVESPNSTTHLLAHCQDCHAQDGRDLKYYNFSNYSIIQRSVFHGLSPLIGQQIASYIRAGIPNAPAFSPYARPWNPVYQPGPGLNSHGIANWAAGAGAEWVLDDDRQTFNYLFPPNGVPDISKVGASDSINKREIPVFLPLPVWNQWLPSIAPVDAYPNFKSSGLFNTYLGMRANLASNQADYILNKQKGSGGTGSSMNADLYRWLFGDRMGLGLPPSPATSINTNYALQLAHWQNVKDWEVMQEFNLEGKLSASEGYNVTAPADDRVWNSAEMFFTALFRLGLPTDPNGPGNAKNNPFYGDQLKDSYFTSAWYYLQIVLHSGQRMRGGNNPIDWGYFLNHQGKEVMQTNPQTGEAGLMTMVWLNSEQENVTKVNSGSRVYNSFGQLLDADYGWSPTWGANIQDLVFPEYWNGSIGPWADLDDAYKSQLFDVLLRAWLAQSQTWTPAQYRATHNDDDSAYSDPTYQCNDGNYGGSHYGDRLYDLLVQLTPPRQRGGTQIPQATINSLAQFGASLFGACNWQQFQK